MMTRTLILVKHSNSAATRDKPPSQWALTAKGRERASLLAQHLAQYQPASIVSSPMPKAEQTAAIVAEALGMSYTIQPDLHEHARDQNAPYFDDVADFKAAVRRVLTERDAMTYGEETGNQAAARFARGVSAALDEGSPCVIVAHGTVISLWLDDHIHDLDVVALWESLKLPSFVMVQLDGDTATLERIVTDAGIPPHSR